MRAKIIFFLLGAAVATLSYIAGENLNANEQATKVGWLHVSEGIIVGNNRLEGGKRVLILPDRILVSGDNDVMNLIASDRVSIENTEKTVKCMIGIGGENSVAVFGNEAKKHYVGIQLEPAPQVVINKSGQVNRIQ